MATRRLSRTIVEGGKRRCDKEERREHIIRDRRIARDFCTTYCEESYETEPVFRAKHYYREFGDRLNALHNFLTAHIGVHWDIIYSKICAIKSRKTIQGHHFIEHAKSYVFTSTGSADTPRSYGFYLEDGILRYKEFPKYKSKVIDKETRLIYESWVGNRKIRLVGSKYFWYEPVTNTVPYHIDAGFSEVRHRDITSAYRQGKPLSAKEIGHMEWLKNKNYRFWSKLIGK